ncbi:adenylate cyclase type 10-like [Engraulis encrasicolus]|uniref:adenylate cyclase type 10-like n=1 Tax=Engraulis encrasicolus TaxID=184585 RepID=UPI002FD176E6
MPKTKVYRKAEMRRISRIAAHVPDLVVYSDFRKIPYVEHFNGVLLFADVSGFTALTEKFSLSNKKGYGADELTRTLNSYIGDIVTHILAAGGDILNYAGDAILALWTVERSLLSEVISLVVKCSLNIQDNCGVRETAVGSVLRVKIGISAGKLSKVIMGNEENQYFVVIGRAVDEVRLAEGLAVAGNIILSPNAWELCDRANIAVDFIENERAVKVRYLKRDPNFSVEAYEASVGKNVEHDKTIKGCIRKASRLMPNEEREMFMQKYIIKTVLQKIDAEQALEYLSEMRPATIVFVNLQFKSEHADAEQCMAIHKASLGIGRHMAHHHGRINKVFMFDKGCTFLCLFGLPGDKREDESAHALQAAFGAYEFCSKEIRSLRTVSVGVTTGPVFCGVVGHILRHEYTVIGKKVNLAARLMMYYPGVVSCDSETHHYSRLPPSYFTELPKKPMKGCKDPGPIYQFTTKKARIAVGQSPMSVERDKESPLLGREKEMEVYSNSMKHFQDGRMFDTHTYDNVVIFGGGSGYGKSRILAEVVYRARRDGFRVVACELVKTDIHQQTYTLQTLLALLLKVESCKSFAERERVILSQIDSSEMKDKLCLLNEILLVKFPVSTTVSLMDKETREKETKNFILKLFCDFARDEPCIYVIDQADFVDHSSWAFLLEMLAQAHVMLFLSVLPYASQRDRTPELLALLKAPRTVFLKLIGLEPTIIAQFACQILGVIRIPTELELFLVERSHGVPYYCWELVKSLYLCGMIYITELEEDEECPDLDILFPGPTVTVPRTTKSFTEDDQRRKASTGIETGFKEGGSALKCRKVEALDEANCGDQKYICLASKGAKFYDIPIPLTLKGMALAHLDQLQPGEQMVVKCAAIIGHTFTTQMLINILPELTEDKLNETLVSLFRSGTFLCGSRYDVNDISLGSEKYGLLSCFCDREQERPKGEQQQQQEEKKERKEGAPWEQEEERSSSKSSQEEVYPASVEGMWLCEVMRFRTALVKETAYDLWLQEQRRDMHSKCAAYLLKHAHRCSYCPDDEFIYGHKKVVGRDIIEINPVLNVQESCEKVLLEVKQKPPNLTKRRGTVMVNPEMMSENTDVEDMLAALDDIIQEHQSGALQSKKCHCVRVVDVVLNPMARHWMGVGDVAKALYYLIETAAANIYLAKNLKALTYLNECQIILENVKAGRSAFDTAAKSKVRICRFEKACVHRLKGEVLFNTGQLKEAEAMFLKALKLLNHRMPSRSITTALKFVFERLRRTHVNKHKPDRPEEKRLAYLHEQIYSLSYMWKISCIKRLPNIRRGTLAIVMEGNCAKYTTEQDKLMLYMLDKFQFSQVAGLEEDCRHYEQKLLALCSELPDTPDAYRLISHFIRNLCLVRLCEGRLEDAIQYGFQARRAIKVLNQVGVDMWLLASLCLPMLFTGRYGSCNLMTVRLEHLSNVTGVTTAKGWFYTACFNCMLYAGFMVRQLDECLLFVEESQSDPCLLADKGLMFTLYSALALWYVRLTDWNRSRMFYMHASALSREAPSTLQSISGRIMFLEVNVLLVKKALMEFNPNIKHIYKATLKCFADFKQRYSTNQIYSARVLHLRAYLNQLTGQEGAAQQLLQKALTICDAQGNKLERSWIQQNQEVWQLPPEEQEKGHLSWFVATMTMPEWDDSCPPTHEELRQHRYVFTTPTLSALTPKTSAQLTGSVSGQVMGKASTIRPAERSHSHSRKSTPEEEEKGAWTDTRTGRVEWATPTHKEAARIGWVEECELVIAGTTVINGEVVNGEPGDDGEAGSFVEASDLQSLQDVLLTSEIAESEAPHVAGNV